MTRVCVVAISLVAAVSGGCGAATTGTAMSAAPGAEVEGAVLGALRSVDGHAAALPSGERPVVLFWVSSRCPCVRRYKDRMNALRARYGGRVTFRAVASNAGEGAAELQQFARRNGLDVPIVVDPGGRLAAALGVRSTPTTAILSGAGRVAFVGWIDNEHKPGEDGRKPWVRQALDAVLAGRTPGRAATPVWGCTITRSLTDSGRCVHPPG